MKALTRILIGVLCAAAGALIVLILSGSGVDETAARAIWTAIALSFFGLTAVAGIYLVERRWEFRLLGYATVATSVVAFPWVTLSIWSGDVGWRGSASAGIAAAALSQASMLLAGDRPEDSEAVRRIRAGTVVAIGLLATMAIIDIVADDDVIGAKAIAVVAILYLLGYLVLPLARRSAGGTRPPAASSALETLQRHGLQVVEGPVPRTGAHGPGMGVSLREPDGTLVELITYGNLDPPR